MKGRWQVFIAMTLASAFIVTGFAQWDVQTLEMEGRVGEFTSIQIDSQGHLHITYYDESRGALKHAWKEGSDWQTEVVDEGDVGWFTSLAVDSQSNLYVAYYDYGHCDLKYAWWDGSGWHTEVIDAEGDVGLFASLQLDSLGRPHVLYYDNTDFDLKHAWKEGGMWRVEVVDSAGDVGMWCSLAIGPGDVLHVSYYDFDNGDLLYARKAADGWQIQTVEAEGTVGDWGTSIDVDSSGHPHIAYFDGTNWVLKHAWLEGGTWRTEVVDDTWGVGRFPALQVDPRDGLHLAYRDDVNREPKYAFFDGVEWESKHINPAMWTADYGYWNSIAVTEEGEPYIGCYDADFGSLFYLWPSMSPWDEEWPFHLYFSPIPVDGLAGLTPYVVFDDVGTPHVVYADPCCKELVHAWREGVAWQFERRELGFPRIMGVTDLDWGAGALFVLYGTGRDLGWLCRTETGVWHEFAAGIGGYRPTVQAFLPSGDLPRYCVAISGRTLELARCSTGCSNVQGYKVQSIHMPSSPGHVDIALSSDETAYVVYRIDGELHCRAWTMCTGTYQDLGQWTVDDSGDVGAFSSIEVDSLGHPHVSYFDTGNGDLKYAWYDGTSWHTEVVDSEGYVGLYTSLELDAEDHPHISYYDLENGDLKYAWHDGTSWHTEAVDSEGDVGLFSCLALDADGDPHIVYFDRTNTAVKYAVKEVGCTYSLSPTSQHFPAAGGTGSVNVSTQSGCSWTAVSNAAWIHITSGSSGTGSGTVSYSVDANESPDPRTGTMTIAGNVFTVTQNGISCTYSLSSTSQHFPAAGGTGSVNVSTQSGCSWTAVSNAAWIHITSGSSGTGSGTVSYSVDANEAPDPRTGTMTIAGQSFTVTQAGIGGTYCWQEGMVQIEARGSGTDAGNWFGVEAGTSECFDIAYDIEEPTPPPGDYTSLYFLLDPSCGDARGLTRDIRAPIGCQVAETWVLEVEDKGGATQVTLSWDPAQLPGEACGGPVAVTLHDTVSGRSVDMKANSSYSYTKQGNLEIREFIITVSCRACTLKQHVLTPASWHMIVLPGEVCGECGDGFGDLVCALCDDLQACYLFHYDPGTGGYVIAPPPENVPYHAGMGFWVRTYQDDVTIDAEVEAVTGPVEVELANGWLQLGNPYEFPLSIEGLKVKYGDTTLPLTDAMAQGWVSAYLFLYDPESGGYQVIAPPDGVIPVWAGFWFRSYVDEGWLVISPVEAPPAAPTEALRSEELRVLGMEVPPPPPSLPELAGQIRVVPVPNPVRDVNTTTFRVLGICPCEVAALRVEIYDTAGNLVWQGEAQGAELTWHTENLAGEFLANGVYLYRAEVKVDGQWIAAQVKKLAIYH